MIEAEYNSQEFESLCSEIRRCYSINRSFKVVSKMGKGIILLTGKETRCSVKEIGGERSLASFDKRI